MEKIIVIIISFLLSFQLACAEMTVSGDGFKDMDVIIKDIRKEYNNINSQAYSYTKKTVNLYDESTEGAQAIGYYKNDELKKIIIWYYGETGKALKEYYYKADNFFFVYSKEFRYKLPIYNDSNVEVINSKEDRYYFYNGTLIKWISGNKTISSISKEFSSYNEYFIAQFAKYKNIFINGQRDEY
jgi:hypothetical protein